MTSACREMNPGIGRNPEREPPPAPPPKSSANSTFESARDIENKRRVPVAESARLLTLSSRFVLILGTRMFSGRRVKF